MGIKEWLIPQDKTFFDLLQHLSETVLAGAEQLNKMIMDYKGFSKNYEELRAIEHQGDDIVHKTYEKLNRTFITPIDREDLSRLTTRYDDVLDFVDGIGKRLTIYEIPEPTENMKRFVGIILQSVKELDHAFTAMRRIDEEEIQKRCIEVDRLENVADDLLRTTIAQLFKGKDAIEIMKLKEIYETMETVTDVCEDVSLIMRDIVIKYT